MTHKIELVYSKSFLDAIAKQSWFEGYVKGYSWYMAIPAFALLLMALSPEPMWTGLNALFSGFMVGVLVTLAGHIYLTYVSVHKEYASLSFWRTESPMIYTFDDEGVKYSDMASSGQFLWWVVERLEQNDLYWQFHFKGQGSVLFPLEVLDAETQKFIVHKLSTPPNFPTPAAPEAV